MNPKFTPILKWYSGKSLEGAKLALTMLTEAEALGYWPKGNGGSRKVHALLNKQNVSRKYLRKDGKWSADLTRYDHPLHDFVHGMMFGAIDEALRGKGHEFLSTDPTIASWVETCAPVAEAVNLLDATRPKPVYFMGTLSATVLGNVGNAMGVGLKTLAIPEMEWKLVEKLDPKGKLVREWEVEILWPEGTKHNASKYAMGNRCHACGHRIYNPFNWVPMVGESPDGPVSLWTGKDCAENLFGCKVENTEVSLPGAPAQEVL